MWLKTIWVLLISSKGTTVPGAGWLSGGLQQPGLRGCKPVRGFCRPSEALNSLQAALGELSRVPGMREWKHSLTLAALQALLPGDAPVLCRGGRAPVPPRPSAVQQPLP